MIEHMDNFSLYGLNQAALNNMTNGVWAQTGSLSLTGTDVLNDPDGVSPGHVLCQAPTPFSPYQSCNRFVLSGTYNTVGVALRMWLSAIPINNNSLQRITDFRNASNTTIATAYVDTTGRILIGKYATDGATITQMAASNGPVLTANAWWHIETKLTSSSMEVRVEGVTVVSVNSQTFPNVQTGIAQVALAVDGQGTNNAYFKDFICWNGTGTYNNDFMGSCVVYTMFPNSDTAVPWNKVGGSTGYGIMDTTPPTDGSIYLDAPYPPPAALQFGLGDLPSNVTSVKGLMTMVRAKKIDGGDGNLQNGLVSGAATGLGVNRPITAAFTYWRDVFETDPATSAPWTVAGANAAQMKVNRTT